MSNIGLCTCGEQRRVSRFHDPSQGTNFNRISQGCSGAMALCYGDLAGSNHGLSHGLADAGLLRHPVWSCQRRTSTILIDVGAHQTAKLLEVVLIIVARLDVDSSESVSSCITLCTNIEGKAPALGRQHRWATQTDECPRAREHVDAHAQSIQVVLVRDRLDLSTASPPHGLHCGGDTDQRGRTSCVDICGAAAQSKNVRQPSCRHRLGNSTIGQMIALAVSPRNGAARIQRILKNLELPEGIPIAASITQEGRCTATHKRFAIKSSFPQTRITILQYEPLVRRHQSNFIFSNSEKVVVETGDLLVGHHGRMPHITLARKLFAFWTAINLSVKPCSRNVNETVNARCQHTFKTVQVLRSARHMGMHGHDVHSITCGHRRSHEYPESFRMLQCIIHAEETFCSLSLSL
mmetsp:Transcript_72282/g.172598  ORF Transcript_72282/g.172598 Transcript_72282/m.172598 type:complete len:407 (+) Transcript_72282:1691-2911(+)